MLLRLSENLFHLTGTCQVYVNRSGHKAVLVDFGTAGCGPGPGAGICGSPVRDPQAQDPVMKIRCGAHLTAASLLSRIYPSN
jgi:hypothetical protein